MPSTMIARGTWPAATTAAKKATRTSVDAVRTANERARDGCGAGAGVPALPLALGLALAPARAGGAGARRGGAS